MIDSKILDAMVMSTSRILKLGGLPPGYEHGSAILDMSAKHLGWATVCNHVDDDVLTSIDRTLVEAAKTYTDTFVFAGLVLKDKCAIPMSHEEQDVYKAMLDEYMEVLNLAKQQKAMHELVESDEFISKFGSLEGNGVVAIPADDPIFEKVFFDDSATKEQIKKLTGE